MSRFRFAYSDRPRSERSYSLETFRRSNVFGNRRRRSRKPKANVGRVERIASVAAGTALAAMGISRKSLSGILLAGFGGGLVLRGATGHCGLYDKLDVDTAKSTRGDRGPHPARSGIHVVESILICKSANDIYAFWRNFESLPRIMSHLKSVHVFDDRRSRWVVEAPRVVGGRVEWDAEIIRDEPGARIAWQSLPGSQLDQRGMVTFLPAPGDRGVIVRVDVEYRPPAGQIGHWIATVLGEDPSQQIHEDLRNFKRTVEIGEVITVEGQSRGNCSA